MHLQEYYYFMRKYFDLVKLSGQVKPRKISIGIEFVNCRYLESEIINKFFEPNLFTNCIRGNYDFIDYTQGGDNMKKALYAIPLCIFTISLLWGAYGCTSNLKDVTPSTVEQTKANIETPEPTSVPTKTPTPIPTPTQIPTPTPTPSVDDYLLMAPEISGLRKEIQDDRVNYFAASANEYGLNDGAFAGIYLNKEIIAVEGAPTGGVALISQVVGILLDQTIAEIPDDELLKMKIVLPLDVIELTKEDKFNIDYAKATSYDINKNFIVVHFNNPIELINSSFTAADSFGRTNDLYDYSFTKDGTDFELLNLSSISPDENGNFSFILFDGSVSTFQCEKKYELGEKFNISANSCFATIWINGETDTVDLNISSLLKTNDGAVIFIYPQNTVLN